MKRVVGMTLLEVVVLLALGTTAGLVANAASERGIRLDKDHLRRSKPMPTPAPTAPAAVAEKPATDTETPQATPTLEPESNDPFQYVHQDEVVAIYQGDLYQIDVEIMIDARDDDHYLEGHIPGAYQLDHYRSERYLPDLVPICQNATRIVVYCNGGDCEDSKLATEDLMFEGIDPTKLYVYEGGITEWRGAGLPVEAGQRLSGEITEGGE